MLVVLDTNILVSALLSPFGPPARVLDLVLTGDLRVAYDDRILAEYREVLARPKFGFAPDDVAALLAYFESTGEHVVSRPLTVDLPDRDDLAFLEVAAEAGATLVTGNAAHYPPEMRGEVDVFPPGEFIRKLSSAKRG